MIAINSHDASKLIARDGIVVLTGSVVTIVDSDVGNVV